MDAEKIWKILLVASVSMARVGQGMFLSIPGPTLLYLTELYSVDVSRISLMFTLRSVGLMTGAASYSALMYKFKNFNQLSAAGISALLLGLAIGLIPWYKNFAGLLTANFVAGSMFSLFDAAMQTFYLLIWAEEDVGPFIQALHFGISLGGVVTPLITTPFMEKAYQGEDSNPSCPTLVDESIDTTNAPSTVYATGYENYTTTVPYEIDSLNPVAWSYVIVGGFSVLSSIPLFAFWAAGLDRRIQMKGNVGKGGNNEEPIKDVWRIILLLGAFYFLNDTLVAGYSNYIYSISYCMDIGFTVSQAASLNLMYWIGYTIARLVAIPYSNYFTPGTIIAYVTVLINIAMVVICIFGQDITLILWICTLLVGLTSGIFYPTGVTWASRVTDISGKYMFVFLFSAGLDSMLMLPLAGVLFEISPFYVMYLITGAALLLAFVYIGMEIAARRHLTLRALKEHIYHEIDDVKDSTKL